MNQFVELRKLRRRSGYAMIAFSSVIIATVFIALAQPVWVPLVAPGPKPTPNPCVANAIEISILYSPEEDLYLPQVMTDFNRLSAEGLNPVTGQPVAAGQRPICITGRVKPAGEVREGIVNAIFAPNNQNVERPTIWAPSVSHWLLLTNGDAGRQLFNLDSSRATAIAPVVIAIWESRLNAIHSKVGYNEIGWEELLQVLNSPNGWCDYELPNCRHNVYYGHTNPFNSSTALSTLIAEFKSSARANGFTDRRLTVDIVENPAVQQGVRDIEYLIRHYSDKTTEFKYYIAQGPDYVDFVALEENDLIAINRGLGGQPPPPEKLVALYPKEGTFLHEHPFGIVNAEWVTEEQRAAAVLFTDYVLTPAVQALIMEQGFRPANPAVALEYPLVSENGVDTSYPKALLEVPDFATMRAIQESWRYVKKKADILLLIDTSGSMNEDNKLSQARLAAKAFLERMKEDPMQMDNRVGLSTFDTSSRMIVPIDSLEGSEEALLNSIDQLNASGGTALYDAVVSAIDRISREDCNNRIPAIVLLSDGQDRDSRFESYADMLAAIKASQDSDCPVVIIPIAYGDDADIQTLTGIARESKTRMQVGDPNSIAAVLDVIRGYF